MIKLFKIGKKEFPPAEVAILRGDILAMEITQGPIKDLKIKGGHNKINGKYYIQITHRKTLYSFRYYFTEEEFKNFVYAMQKTISFTEDEQGKKQDEQKGT
jgi:hypothetical protein